jgi:hypothetical protein
MNREEVKAIVDREIRLGWNGEDPGENPHGIALARCLLRVPERRTYLNSFEGNRSVDMWLVLEEDPERHAGYEVVFDEASGEFGLAIQGTDRSVFIGFYGSFRETLRGM